jgi:hypothetical protein
MSRRSIHNALVVASALSLGACDQGCPEGTYEEDKQCLPRERGPADAAAVTAEAPADKPDAGREDGGQPAAGRSANMNMSTDAGAPQAGSPASTMPTREEDAAVKNQAGSAADGGGGAGAPAEQAPAGAGGASGVSGADAPAPDAPAPEPRIGRSLLFWGDAAATYPFAGDALIRTERLSEGKYRVTGKLGMRNPAELALDVTCTVKLDQAINIERISVPPATDGVSGAVSLFLIAVGATGPSYEQQRADLTCTCASGDACTGLIFESLGIIATTVAADSGTVQKPSPATD